MDSVVLTTANAKTLEANKLRLELTSNLRLENQIISLSKLSIYYTWRDFKAEYGTTQQDYSHIPSSTNVAILIPNGLYSVEDINNFIHHEMLHRKHENADGTFGINVYAHAVYNRITIDVSNNFILALKAGIRETFGLDNTQSAFTNKILMELMFLKLFSYIVI